MGGKETSGKAKRRSSQFQTADSYIYDFYWDSDHDHGAGVFIYVSNWETIHLNKLIRIKETKIMKNKMEKELWKMIFKFREKFLYDEEGDSNMVAVVVLIAIVIFVGYIFKDALVEAVNSVFDQLTEFIG